MLKMQISVCTIFNILNMSFSKIELKFQLYLSI